MGLFDDFLSLQKADIAGTIPIGGTFVGTSEGVPMAMIQQIKGAPMVLPDLDTLADFPYSLMQIQMELTVAEVEGVSVRTKYILYNLPPEDTKVNEIVDFDILDYWQAVVFTEPAAIPGAQGEKGWAPVFGLEGDGAGRVVEVLVDYVGGQGSKPTLPDPAQRYKGAGGFTTKSLAVNVMGSTGPAGVNSRPEYYVVVGTKQLSTPGTPLAVANGDYIYANVDLPITNSHTSARNFVVRAEVPVTNSSGSNVWEARLLQRANTSWNSDPSLETGIIDINSARKENANSLSNESPLKIVVQAIINLLPAQTVRVRLAFTQTNGPTSLYSSGMIEAFGL